MSDSEVDVVVVGSGGAGLSAALAAAVAGAEVLVLEGSERWGGTTAISGAQVWVPANHRMAEAGVPDSFEQALDYCRRHSIGRDPGLIETFLRTAPRVARLLEQHSPLRFAAASADPRLAPGGRGRQGRPAPRARTDRGRRPGRSRGPGVAGGVPDGLHQRRGGSARPDRRRTAARGAVRPAHRRRAGVHGPGAGDRPAARLSRCRGATGTRTSSRSPAARGLPGHRRGNRQRRR